MSTTSPESSAAPVAEPKKSAYAECLEDIASLRARADELRPVSETVEAIVAATHLNVPRQPEVNIYVGLMSHNKVVISLWDVERLSDLTPLRRAIRAAGFPPAPREDEDELRRVTWNYGPNLRLQAMLKWDEKAACRFVQVGTKEVPVYKVMCDPDSDAEANGDVNHS